MNRRSWGWLFALGLVGWLAASSARAEVMRCGLKLVTDDSPIGVVQSTCGAPTVAVHHVDQRPYAIKHSDGTVSAGLETVVVDQWTYDFGPTQFVYNLTFENGRMVAMIQGSWGKSR